jgi:DNA helicase-4
MFTELMGGGTELKITHTYRNSQELIDIAGNFIQQNPDQITKRLISDKSLPDPIKIIGIESGHPGFMVSLSTALSDVIGNIVDEYGEESSILILSRYNFDRKKLVATENFEEVGKTKVKCLDHPNVDIDFLTVHRSKGLGYDNVIIMNLSEGKYGFPSQIEDDPIIRLVSNFEDDMEFAEERRLFYVALTRTKNRVYVLAPNNNPSRFLIELFKNHGVEIPDDMNEEITFSKKNRCIYCGYPLKYEDNKTYGLKLYVCTNDQEVCGCMSNNKDYPYSIKKCPNCEDGYLVVRTKGTDVFYGCTNYKLDKPGCSNMIQILRNGRKVLDDFYDIP